MNCEENQSARVKCEVGDAVFVKEIGGVVQYNRTVQVKLVRAPRTPEKVKTTNKLSKLNFYEMEM